ncbi:MAG: aspartyl protease family protein [Gemmatimonadetes bacterium]|nr:aspartyl protease family protein [Gemmatimonadota bacterium]
MAKAGTFAASSPPPTVTTFPALLDTGASRTCIAPTVAQALGLLPVGMRPMVSATHAVPVNVYVVDLVMPFGNAGYVLGATQVMEFGLHGAGPFQVLVGRDIICQGTLHMSFDGHFTFCL